MCSSDLTSSLVLVLALALPATAGLVLLAEPIIRLIFEHGAFTATDTQATAQALCWYSVGLFAYAANKVMVPVFYATGNTRYPVIGSFLGVAANLAVINLVIASTTNLTLQGAAESFFARGLEFPQLLIGGTCYRFQHLE